MRVLLLCSILLGVPSGLASAQDIASPPTRQDADALAAVGLQAMKEADGDPHRGVDAALAFSHALATYQKLGDVDAVCEMQADIFWCKKRMNMSDLQTYVAQKGGAAKADFANVEKLITEEVPVTEAAAYLERAQKYQAANPDKHFETAIRFSEIIERFPDSDAAHQASAVFAKEQTLYLGQVSEERKHEQEQLKQEIDQIRRNRFMRPPSVAVGTVTVPEKASQDKALATIKNTYKDDYQAARKDATKRALAHKFFAEAENNKEDASVYFVMLDESTRLAMESEDYEQLLSAIERMGETYKGFDADARKREVLNRIKGKATAAAILKLMDDPKDRRANVIAGKFFCFDMQRWDLGLPMLSLGDDADLHKVAEMELSDPKQPADQRATGDAWYDLGRKVSGSEKTRAWLRAQHWYNLALGSLNGVNKTMVEKRLEEIDAILPLADIDYDNLTTKQWEKLKGQLVTIEAKVDRSNGGVQLSPQKRVRVVPHPDDKDKMVFLVGNGGDRQDAGVLTGNGQLWVVPTTRRRGGRDLSTLRMKIIVLSDED